jgi:glycosyltransferase involved in cell wall biosynthesis
VSARKPVVCQLVHTLNVGGAELLAGNISRRLRDRYDFAFACLDEEGQGADRLRADGFRVALVGRADGLDWRCPLRLAALWRQWGVDLVQAHQYTPFFYALAARLRYRRPAVVFTEHGRHYPDYPRTKRMVINRFAIERRDRVVAVGPSVKRALISHEGIPAGWIEVIPNGIDTDRFAPAPQTRAGARKALGYGPGEYVVLMVARLDAIKDHPTALRAAARAANEVPGLRLVLAGDGPERAAIEAAVRDQNLGHIVRLLGTRDDVPRLLAAADTLLLTSVSEGIPLTVIEAMAAGVPVVSTDVGSIAPVVAGGAGLLAPARDAAALAAHLVRLGRSAADRAALGAAGRARAVAEYSEAKMADRYAALFDAALRVRLSRRTAELMGSVG